MDNNDFHTYFMAARESRRNRPNTPPLPSSPPYDNLIVINAPPTISLQPTQRPQYEPPLIPGPGQQIQHGLFRKRAHDEKVVRGESSQSRPTQHFIREVMNDPIQTDLDFSTPQWTSTIDYLLREGTFNNRETPFWIQISEIFSPVSQFLKVKKLVVIISTITPNGLGDLLVTLKDPSGKIDGTMHRKIFLIDEHRLATTVGAVAILRNVTVTRFSKDSKFLNITAKNIVKIIGVNSKIAEYEPTPTTLIEDEDVANTEYEYETVPDSDGEE